MDTEIASLNKLPIGKKGTVVALDINNATKKRLLDLGIIEGTTIEALHKSPSGDPVAYFVRGSVIALRSEDTKQILIKPIGN